MLWYSELVECSSQQFFLEKKSLLFQNAMENIQIRTVADSNFLAGHLQEKALDKVLKLALKAQLKVWSHCMT